MNVLGCLSLGSCNKMPKWSHWDFLGGPVVKNSSINAVDMSLILVWKDSTCPGATKPEFLNCWAHALQQEKLPQWEAQASQLETSPYLPELEKALLQQWRPSAAKNILKKWSHWRFTHYLGLHELGSKMQPKHNSCPCFLFNMIHLVFQLSHWTNWGWDKKFSYL